VPVALFYLVDGMYQSHAVIETGGKEVLTRKEINEIIQRIVVPNKKIRSFRLDLSKLYFH
jgi:hypothetical protein